MNLNCMNLLCMNIECMNLRSGAEDWHVQQLHVSQIM